VKIADVKAKAKPSAAKKVKSAEKPESAKRGRTATRKVPARTKSAGIGKKAAK
jgi:hypothetical protein